MKQDKLLTVREVAHELGVSEGEVIGLAEQGKIPAYKIGGVYLRFKPEHVQEVKQEISKSAGMEERVSVFEKLQDFFYFNDFYIVSFLIIILMIIIIFNT
ncbi:MAG: helix-turn-helix domain-containing protein [Candidatus Omnitrophota bacterium]